jgi:hypothetical protein
MLSFRGVLFRNSRLSLLLTSCALTDYEMQLYVDDHTEHKYSSRSPHSTCYFHRIVLIVHILNWDEVAIMEPLAVPVCSTVRKDSLSPALWLAARSNKQTTFPFGRGPQKCRVPRDAKATIARP